MIFFYVLLANAITRANRGDVGKRFRYKFSRNFYYSLFVILLLLFFLNRDKEKVLSMSGALNIIKNQERGLEHHFSK